MSTQPSLLQKANDGQVILPSSDEQVQVVRDKSAFGLGRYWAYFLNGTKELIGGPPVAPFNFSVAMTTEGNDPGTKGLIATPSVGVIGDYTYSWTLSDWIEGGLGISPLVLSAAVDPNKRTISNPTGSNAYGMVVVTVTHTASGAIQQAYIFSILGIII